MRSALTTPPLRLVAALAVFLAMGWPGRSEGQAGPSPAYQGPPPLYVGLGATDARWELKLNTRLGLPDGALRVGEGGNHGTRLRLVRDLGLDVSEAAEASLAFRFTPRDAVRVTGLYYLLDNSATFREAIRYNDDRFGPGHVRANADFYRLSLAYERLLLNGYGMFLTGSGGLTYVHLEPKLSSRGHSSREDFYRHELPVPIAGVRIEIPMGERFAARASLAGGGLPAVDSLRKEGGTVHLTQIHVDGEIAVTYALARNVALEAGYNYFYFFQHQTSSKEDNLFELSDSGFRFGLSFAF
jgi:hypothetical protein